MPSFCAVSSCEQKYTHSDNVSFHKFPLKEPRILIEWIKFTNRGLNWKPSRWNSICSRHFVKSDFREDLSRKCLKKDAIPTILTKNTISYETFHFSPGSPEDIGTIQSEQDDYIVSRVEDGKGPSEMIEMCRLCGERADGLTCNPVRTLDEPEIELMFRKCLPAVNIYGCMDQCRAICIECIAQLRQYSDFIDKVFAYQREAGCNESFDSFAANENNQVNGNVSLYRKSSTPNPSTIFIKQEPINVKQEKVDNSHRRPFTVQAPMTSPSMCLNPYAESMKITGIMQQEVHAPKTEIGSTYCQLCDRIFGNNFEFRSHKCTSAELMDRDQGNNCEIMEVITLNNPVSYIDLAEDENITGIEPMRLKTESFSEIERKERLEFEHAYAKRATNTSCNLKQEIIDPNNDASENGYDYADQFTEHEEQQGFHQNSYFEGAHPTYYNCSKCNQSFVSQELLDEHSAYSHPLNPRVCSICSAEFKSSYDYLIHKSKVHLNRFQCKQCKQKFNTPSILRSHQRLCTRESEDFYFSCRHCGKSIRNLGIMKKHLNNCIGKHTDSVEKMQHPVQKPTQDNVQQKFTCDICNRIFSRLKQFKQHKEMHQSREGFRRIVPEKVENPDNDISDPGDVRAMNLGEMINNGDSDIKQGFKFIVDDSKFIFLNESKVLPINESNEDLNTKFNGKFACDTCGRPFSSFVQLKQHKLEHDSERKFNCSLCPKTFKGISGLKQHISGYHYKIRPFSCPVCHYSYALKGDMQRCRHSKLKNQTSFKVI